VGLELRVKTAGYDLHSSYGAVVQNPLYRLSKAIASLRDDEGKVLVKGFYNGVRALTELEGETLARIPDESPELAQTFGVEGFLGGVSGRAFYQKLLAEPCINVNGIHGGYGGPGSKTVLPAEAFAKLDVRLVPDQEPQEIAALIRQHLKDQGFDDVELVVSEFGERPARSDLASPWVQQAIEACREVYGQEPVVWPNFAGSGPMHPFTHLLQAPVVGLGVGYPGSKVHSPDEHIRIRDFEAGIAVVKRAMEKFAGL
jgi:acetylornithine deacetylase/succinyl-diaminopimelate desuccinylase-like protein